MILRLLVVGWFHDLVTFSPPLLKLSVEVLENSGNPVKSVERDAQTKRLGHVLEVRYV